MIMCKTTEDDRNTDFYRFDFMDGSRCCYLINEPECSILVMTGYETMYIRKVFNISLRSVTRKVPNGGVIILYEDIDGGIYYQSFDNFTTETEKEDFIFFLEGNLKTD